MKTLVRIAVAGALTVAVLAAIYAIMLRAPEQAAFSGVIFSSREPVDVRSVAVRNESGSFHFFFDPEEGGYVVDDIPPFIVDIDYFIGFMTNSARIAAVRRIPLTDENLRNFGLDDPAAEVEIEFFDGEILRIGIGGVERVSGNFYAIVEGFDGVYVIPQGIARQFTLPKSQVISRFVTPQLAVTSPLSAIRDITFTGGSLERPVTIHATAGAGEEIAQAAKSFGATTHIVRGGATYQLDQSYGIQILGSLFAIPAVDILGYDLSDEAIASFGFAEPYMAVDYDMINGRDAELVRMQLRVVQAGDGMFHATLLGSGVVYLIDRVEFLDIEYERLLLRWFLTPLLMDLASVTLVFPDRTYRLDIDSADPLNITVAHGGRMLDMELFHAFFRLITGAAHDGAYLGTLDRPGVQPLLAIIYEYTDGSKPPDVMELHHGGVRRANVFVNGAGEFAMRDTFIQRTSEGIANLLSGSPIEENW